MNRKSLLFAAAGAAILLASGPAYAGAGAMAQVAREQRGDHDGGRGEARRDNGGDSGRSNGWQGRPDNNPGGQNRGGQNQPGQNQPGQGRQDNNPRGQWQGGQSQQPRTQQEPGGASPRYGQGGGARQWRGQTPPAAPQEAWRNDNPRGGNDNGRRWAGNNNRRDDGNRNWGGNNNRDRNWGNNNNNRGWNSGWNDNRDRRSYAAIPYGRYFGPSYGSIASRFYGRNYIYYGSRSWSSWDRPYRVGYILPPTLYCTQLPYDLYYDLPPPPYGYDYALCGRDILLVGLDSRLVIDAIVGWY